MKISSIKQQVKQAGRYSIFVDGKYSFSLSEGALIEHKLASGQELDAEQVKRFKQLSADDKLYNRTLRYVAMRPRSRWEIQFYLQRKEASPTLIDIILNKLSKIGLIDDYKLALAFVHDRQLLRPTSRRRLVAELKKKRIDTEIIDKAIGQNPEDETVALQAVVRQKRKTSKYQDDTKLMQYLARQGFGYQDIKNALQAES
jgi:regulatory protein